MFRDDEFKRSLLEGYAQEEHVLIGVDEKSENSSEDSAGSFRSVRTRQSYVSHVSYVELKDDSDDGEYKSDFSVDAEHSQLQRLRSLDDQIAEDYAEDMVRPVEQKEVENTVVIDLRRRKRDLYRQQTDLSQQLVQVNTQLERYAAEVQGGMEYKLTQDESNLRMRRDHLMGELESIERDLLDVERRINESLEQQVLFREFEQPRQEIVAQQPARHRSILRERSEQVLTFLILAPTVFSEGLDPATAPMNSEAAAYVALVALGTAEGMLTWSELQERISQLFDELRAVYRYFQHPSCPEISLRRALRAGMNVGLLAMIGNSALMEFCASRFDVASFSRERGFSSSALNIYIPSNVMASSLLLNREFLESVDRLADGQVVFPHGAPSASVRNAVMSGLILSRGVRDVFIDIISAENLQLSVTYSAIGSSLNGLLNLFLRYKLFGELIESNAALPSSKILDGLATLAGFYVATLVYNSMGSSLENIDMHPIARHIIVGIPMVADTVMYALSFRLVLDKTLGKLFRLCVPANHHPELNPDEARPLLSDVDEVQVEILSHSELESDLRDDYEDEDEACEPLLAHEEEYEADDEEDNANDEEEKSELPRYARQPGLFFEQQVPVGVVAHEVPVSVVAQQAPVSVVALDAPAHDEEVPQQPQQRGWFSCTLS